MHGGEGGEERGGRGEVGQRDGEGSGEINLSRTSADPMGKRRKQVKRKKEDGGGASEHDGEVDSDGRRKKRKSKQPFQL